MRTLTPPGQKWVMSTDGRTLYDEDTEHDVRLDVDGDWENDKQRIEFARALMTKLNERPVTGGAPEGEVTVTCDEDGNCIAVTRTDEDHRVLSVIWQRTTPLATDPSGQTPCCTQCGLYYFWTGLGWRHPTEECINSGKLSAQGNSLLTCSECKESLCHHPDLCREERERYAKKYGFPTPAQGTEQQRLLMYCPDCGVSDVMVSLDGTRWFKPGAPTRESGS